VSLHIKIGKDGGKVQIKSLKIESKNKDEYTACHVDRYTQEEAELYEKWISANLGPTKSVRALWTALNLGSYRSISS
jgi:hypothetical protein